MIRTLLFPPHLLPSRHSRCHTRTCISHTNRCQNQVYIIIAPSTVFYIKCARSQEHQNGANL
jgi:hypothetical protein